MGSGDNDAKSGNSRAMEMGALEEVIHDERKIQSQKVIEEAEPKTTFQKVYTLIKRDFDKR